jgi:hypothetical protein
MEYESWPASAKVYVYVYEDEFDGAKREQKIKTY